MNLNLTNVVLLLAGAQGFFLTIILMRRYRKLYANRFLAAMIALFSLVLLYLFAYEIGYLGKHPHLIQFFLGFCLLLPPLHYLYAYFLIHRGRRFQKTDCLHFLPFGVYQVFWITYRILVSNEYVPLAQQNKAESLSTAALLYNWIIILISAFYIAKTLVMLHRYSRRLQSYFSSIEKIRLSWLRNTTLLLILFLLVFIVENVFYLFGINLSNFFTLSSTLIAVYVYSLGCMGLIKSEILSNPATVESITQLSIDDSVDNGESEKVARYRKSGLTPEKLQESHQALLRLMDSEHLYQISDLTLAQLAERLQISSHNLSEVLNTQAGKNFFDFINHYRVEQVKKDLLDPAKRGYKLIALAFDAGFNSKSSFNTIFKKYTGMTPSQFRDSKLQR